MKSLKWPLAVVFVVAVLSAVSLRCQTQKVTTEPDCIQSFYFTAAGTQVLPDNSGPQCGLWTLNYTASGFTGLSLRLDSAPDVSNAPGTFVSWAGTLLSSSGTNPQTSLTGSGATPILALGYFRWVQVNLVSNTGTGYVTGTLYGYKIGGGGSSGGGGGSGCPTAAQPCVVGSVNSAGTIIPAANGDQIGVISVSGAGTIQVIAPSVGKTVYVTHINDLNSGGSTLQLIQGTGAACGGSSANVTGQYPASTLGFALDYDGLAPLTLTAGNGLCLVIGSAVTGGGQVVFSQR